ncbi:SDR family NAD(P)-dependent oxidoreductase, partial [Rhodococcus koreensis]
ARVVDVTDAASVASAAEAASEAWGEIDFVVNCAGAFLVGPLAEVSADAVRKLFEVNVLGTTVVTQALLPALVASKGAVVNVASAVALKATASNSHYAASKAAVAHLTRCWALELGPQGVRVNSVAPGPTTTTIYQSAGMSAEQEATLLRERAASIPLRRIGEPAETARWIARFALEDDWTTGTVLPIDGGMSL